MNYSKEYIFIVKNTWKDKQLSFLVKGEKVCFQFNLSVYLKSFIVPKRTCSGLLMEVGGEALVSLHI